MNIDYELTENENAVLQELSKIENDSLWGIAIKNVVADPQPVRVLRLYYQLKSQACDNPQMMKNILGSAFNALIKL